MKLTKDIQKYMSSLGKKGGKTKGSSKVRGDSEYYRRIRTLRKNKSHTDTRGKEDEERSKNICDCIIDPNTEVDHNCNTNTCPSVAHFRKGCRCGVNFPTSSHHKNDCKFCHQKES